MFILFYSSECPHCRTLLNEIVKKDSEKKIKLVCVDILIARRAPIPPQVRSVPALMIIHSKEFIFGKYVYISFMRSIYFKHPYSKIQRLRGLRIDFQ